jgi:carboxypeptidase family protein
VRRGDGSPLPGATVTLIDPAGRQAGIGHSGPDGRYRVPVAAGTYTVIAMADAHEPFAAAVRVTDGQEARADAELRSGARLEGTARNTAGAPVPDARVTLLDADGNVAGVATSGPDGAYSLENLPEGEYTVIATGYPPAASRLKVAGSDPHSHDIELGHPES